MRDFLGFDIKVHDSIRFIHRIHSSITLMLHAVLWCWNGCGCDRMMTAAAITRRRWQLTMRWSFFPSSPYCSLLIALFICYIFHMLFVYRLIHNELDFLLLLTALLVFIVVADYIQCIFISLL